MQRECILNAMRRVSQRQVTGSHVHVERTAQAAGEHGLEQGKSGGRETEEPLYQWLQWGWSGGSWDALVSQPEQPTDTPRERRKRARMW